MGLYFGVFSKSYIFASLLKRECIGRLAQLVQSICLTSRGSAVRTRQPPQIKAPPQRGFLLMYSVYIIYSQKLDKYYIGFSADVQDRLKKHNANSKGFTNLGKPWILMHSEHYGSKKEAMEREKQLKNWKNRERLEALIKKGSEHPD